MVTVTEILLSQNSLLGRFKKNIYAPQNHERKYYLLVFALLEGVNQDIVGDVPDE